MIIIYVSLNVVSDGNLHSNHHDEGLDIETDGGKPGCEHGKTEPRARVCTSSRELANTNITQLVSSSDESLQFSGDPQQCGGRDQKMLRISAKLGLRTQPGRRRETDRMF